MVAVTSVHSAPAPQAPRVVVLSSPEAVPSAKEVLDLLTTQLDEFDVNAEAWEVDGLPRDADAWIAEGRRAAAAQPGTLALFGYLCNERECRLIVVEPKGRSLTKVPVKIPHDRDLPLAFAIAATAREALLGELLPELMRLAEQGENPTAAPPSVNRALLMRSSPGTEPSDKALPNPSAQLLLIEMGYHGEYAHPQSHILHGARVGAAYLPSEKLALGLGAGWVGIDKQWSIWGSVLSHRWPIDFSLRLILPLGPARITIAPFGRLDVVYFRSDPSLPDRPTSKSVAFEFHIGGITSWYLPLPFGFDVLIGAGISGALYAKDHQVDGETVAEASLLRIIWRAGISWGLI